MMVDIIKHGKETLTVPTRLLRRLGSFAWNTLSGEYTYTLEEEEPISRANKAIQGAEEAAELGKDKVVVFEVLRAANAIEEIAKYDPETASEIGPKLTDAALKLPDSDLGSRAIDQAIAKGLDATVKQIDENVHYLPKKYR